MSVKLQGDAWDLPEGMDVQELDDSILEDIAGGAGCKPCIWASTGNKRNSHGVVYYEKRCTKCGATTWSKSP